ncbi:MAG: hypothetical protein ACTHLB_07105 [Parafilimonas sp.]
MRTPFLPVCLLLALFSCTKPDDYDQNYNALESNNSKLSAIQRYLQNSLSAIDFAAVDFGSIYSSKDFTSGNYFFRIGFRNKEISDEFVLLKTDSAGNIIKTKIVYVQWNGNEKALAIAAGALLQLIRNTCEAADVTAERAL